MSKNREELLRKIININEDSSDIESDEAAFEQSSCGNESQYGESVATETEPGNSSSNSDGNENIRNFPRRARMRIISDSDEDDNSNQEDIEIATDGTKWTKLQEGGHAGRSPSQNIFKEVGGLTGYAKTNIMLDNVLSAFSLICDKHIMEHIRICTEAEARRVLKNNWSITSSELNAFIAILYARGAYEAKNLKMIYLWSKKWGPDFFHRTMSPNKFMDILRFIRFDKKSERSGRLQTDKFAMISEVWNRFIANSQACYKPGANITVDKKLFPTKARCRFTQYMPINPTNLASNSGWHRMLQANM